MRNILVTIAIGLGFNTTTNSKANPLGLNQNNTTESHTLSLGQDGAVGISTLQNSSIFSMGQDGAVGMVNPTIVGTIDGTVIVEGPNVFRTQRILLTPGQVLTNQDALRFLEINADEPLASDDTDLDKSTDSEQDKASDGTKAE